MGKNLQPPIVLEELDGGSQGQENKSKLGHLQRNAAAGQQSQEAWWSNQSNELLVQQQ